MQRYRETWIPADSHAISRVTNGAKNVLFVENETPFGSKNQKFEELFGVQFTVYNIKNLDPFFFGFSEPFSFRCRETSVSLTVTGLFTHGQFAHEKNNKIK